MHHEILFVDDEEALVEAARELLDSARFKVHGYTSSTAAYAALETGELDGVAVLVIDWGLSELSGAGLFSKVKEKLGHRPTLFISGNRPHGVEALLASGVVSFIQKPFRFSDLQDTIDSMISRSKE